MLAAGCGTVVRGTNEQVAINVSPGSAQVSTTTRHQCTGSCVITVPRKQAFSVTASAPGYETQTVAVLTKVAGAGVATTAGNILVGGVIGIGVDSVSGANFDHVPNPVVINLQRAEPTIGPTRRRARERERNIPMS